MGSKSPAGNPRLPPMRTYVRRSCCAYVRINSAGAIMAFAEQFLRWAVDGLGESSVCRHVVFSRVVDGLQILRAIERVPTGYCRTLASVTAPCFTAAAAPRLPCCMQRIVAACCAQASSSLAEEPYCSAV
jgi:hypothetical protein